MFEMFNETNLMSNCVKISSYLLLLIISYKLRSFLSRLSDRNKKPFIEQKIVLFFPETQFTAKELIQFNFNEFIASKPFSDLSRLFSVLKSCSKSLDVCMYCIAFEPIIQLIEELATNGVQIRLLINGRNINQSDLSQQTIEMKKISGRLKSLAKFGVKTKAIISHTKDFYMHHKFAIIDNKLLINGSLNWTKSGIFQSYNDCVIINDRNLVSIYCNQFNDFWVNY